MFVAVLCVLSVLVAGSQGQITNNGICPNISPAALTAAQITMLQTTSPWTENRRYYSMFEKNARCIKYSFNVPTAQTPITVTTTMSGGWGRNMIAELTQRTGRGDYDYVMTQNPMTGARLGGTYRWRIAAAQLANAADTQWVLAYSCRNRWNFWRGQYHEEMMWILTAGATLTDAMYTDIRTAAAAANVYINPSQLITPSC